MTDQALRKFVEDILYSDIVPDSAPRIVESPCVFGGVALVLA